MIDEKVAKIKNAPNGFCLAKWYQVTIDLSRGYNHSCHHPLRHKIPLEEIAKDPSALHNTYYKMLQRKMMLEGTRPPECSYCWNIEDTPGEHLSDRFIKTTDDWAWPQFDQTLKKNWDEKISPTYVEVIFSTECNLNCAYCMADVSSSIEREMEKFGPYPVSNQHRMPKEREIVTDNPYVEAFWKWFPQISNGLKIFRITGGEPLLSKNTFKVLEYLEENPAPELELALNTNLSYSPVQLQKFLAHSKVLLAKKAIKSLTIFTSLDGFDEHATYIRKGLDLNKFKENIDLIANSLPETKIILMCTYNILSIQSFRKLLNWVAEIKRTKNMILDISYLKDPAYLAANLATDELRSIMLDDLKFMQSHSQFTDYETKKYERIVDWVMNSKDMKYILKFRTDFHAFINEYDRRFNTEFLNLFPTYETFMKTCFKSSKWQQLDSLS